jgi:hypothetical protein
MTKAVKQLARCRRLGRRACASIRRNSLCLMRVSFNSLPPFGRSHVRLMHGPVVLKGGRAVPNCFECTIGIDHQLEAIGVCIICNSLGCPRHGGKPRGQPRFECAGCNVGILTTSAGGSPPPPPGGGGGAAPGGSPPPPPGGGAGETVGGSPAPLGPGGGAAAGGSSTGPTPGARQTSGFSSTLDFEMQLPLVAAASERWRRSIRPDSLRESVRRLFKLLRDEDSARANFLDRAADELRDPVQEQVARQLRGSDALREVFEDERGGLDALTLAGIAEILDRVRRWFENDLQAWMAQIHPTLDETVWLGERPGTGAIDILLLADAVGLNAYVWNLQIGASPFGRLDIVSRCDTGMLVLSELYAQSLPAIARG